MIFFKKRYAQEILDLFDAAIASRALRTFVKVGDVEYASTSPQWRNAARFRSIVQIDGLLMKLLLDDTLVDGPDEMAPRACYAQLHGALLQAMLRHCSAKLFEIEVSADPAYGDTDF